MTLMMKRAGRGHDSSGVKGTGQGELALQCRACPQPGKNLPNGWDQINWDAMPEDLRCVGCIIPDLSSILTDCPDTNTLLSSRKTATSG